MAESLVEVARVAAAATVARQARDAAIRDAHAQGASLRAIAAAAGISFQRVHQIVSAR